MFEGLSNYLSIVLDYSVVLEYSNGVWFDELTNLFEDKGIDCYIDDTFKILHKCVVQQQDPKDVYVQSSMRSLIQSLMATNTLHVVHTCNTEYFIEQVKDLPMCCILTTRKGIFTKRLYEKAPTFRHKMYDEYKGTRKGMPDELAEQTQRMIDMSLDGM